MSSQLYEYIWVPADVDVANVESLEIYMATVKESEWFNLGEHASGNVERGRQEVFMSIGDFQHAGLKFARGDELPNFMGYVVFKHCRDLQPVVVRPIRKIVLTCNFEPAYAESVAIMICKYSFAVTGRLIGEINVDRYSTIASLKALLISTMRQNIVISPQGTIWLAFAESEDENGKKFSKNCLLRNLKYVEQQLKQHGATDTFMTEFRNGKSAKKAAEKTKIVKKTIEKK